MALINCKECKSEVSSKAETCPKCGARVAPKPMGCGTLIVVLIVGFIVISAIGGISNRGQTSSQASSLTPATQAPVVAAENAEPVAPKSQWTYFQDADKMSKGTTYYASVLSTNTVEFDFPYSGAQRGTLALRNDPRHGKDIIFKIEKGQILCHSYEDCTILVRFDDEKATNYSAIGPADNSTETIFIHNYNRFVDKLLKAKQVRISANIYQQGAPVFEFDVSGFDQNQFKPKAVNAK